MANKNSSRRTANKKPANSNALESLEQGIALVEKGDRQAAFDIFQATAEHHPESADAWVWLGGTSTTLDAAELAFERAHSIDPRSEAASLGLRWVQLQRAAGTASQQQATEAASTDDLAASTVQPALQEVAHVPAAPEPPATAEPAAQPMSGTPSPKAADVLVCPNCGAQNNIREKFCVQCGQDLVLALTQQAAHTHDTDKPQPAGRFNRRTMVYLASVALLLVVIVLLIWYVTTPH